MYRSVRTKSSLFLCTSFWELYCILDYVGDGVLSILSVDESTNLIVSINLFVLLLNKPSFNVVITLCPQSTKLPSFCCIVFVLSRRAGYSVSEKLILQKEAEVNMWVLMMGRLDRWGGFGLGRWARQNVGRL